MFFLLQNWWLKKQFVEVDAQYLQGSCALVYFVTTPQPSIPSSLPALSGQWFETDMVDKPESLFCESAGSILFPL